MTTLVKIENVSEEGIVFPHNVEVTQPSGTKRNLNPGESTVLHVWSNGGDITIKEVQNVTK